MSADPSLTVRAAVQVSDLTGSFRLYRKECAAQLMPQCTSKVGTPQASLTPQTGRPVMFAVVGLLPWQASPPAYPATANTVMLRMQGYAFQMEIIVRARKMGCSIAEVRCPVTLRALRQSKVVVRIIRLDVGIWSRTKCFADV